MHKLDGFWGWHSLWLLAPPFFCPMVLCNGQILKNKDKHLIPDVNAFYMGFHRVGGLKKWTWIQILGRTALHDACRSGCGRCVEALVAANASKIPGINITMFPSWWDPAFHPWMYDYLLRTSSRNRQKYKSIWNVKPIHIATSHQCTACLEALLTGTSVSEVVEAPLYIGQTTTYLKTFMTDREEVRLGRNSLSCCKLCISPPALRLGQEHLKDAFCSLRALDLAVLLNCEPCVQILLSRGASASQIVLDSSSEEERLAVPLGRPATRPCRKCCNNRVVLMYIVLMYCSLVTSSNSNSRNAGMWLLSNLESPGDSHIALWGHAPRAIGLWLKHYNILWVHSSQSPKVASASKERDREEMSSTGFERKEAIFWHQDVWLDLGQPAPEKGLPQLSFVQPKQVIDVILLLSFFRLSSWFVGQEQAQQKQQEFMEAVEQELVRVGEWYKDKVTALEAVPQRSHKTFTENSWLTWLLNGKFLLKDGSAALLCN